MGEGVVALFPATGEIHLPEREVVRELVGMACAYLIQVDAWQFNSSFLLVTCFIVQDHLNYVILIVLDRDRQYGFSAIHTVSLERVTYLIIIGQTLLEPIDIIVLTALDDLPVAAKDTASAKLKDT